MLEKQFENWCRNYAADKGLKFLKWSSPSQRGVCDRILIGPNAGIVFVEVKRPGKKPVLTTLQQLHRDMLIGLGHRHEVVNEKEHFKEIVGSLTG